MPNYTIGSTCPIARSGPSTTQGRHQTLVEGFTGVFINNSMITTTIRISSPGLIFNPTIFDYRLDHAAITAYDEKLEYQLEAVLEHLW